LNQRLSAGISSLRFARKLVLVYNAGIENGILPGLADRVYDFTYESIDGVNNDQIAQVASLEDMVRLWEFFRGWSA